MGEVLQGPWGDRSGAGPAVAAARRGAGGQQRAEREEAGSRPAPSRRPAADRRPETARQRPADEPQWVVPGVDGSETAESPEPASRSQRAENVALAALTRHDASEGEIRAKLTAKGLDAPEVDAELDRLRRSGLLDDAAFATRLVERLRDRKGLGDQAIRSTLRGRLVPPAVVDAVLADQVEDEQTVQERLHEVAEDRARRLGALPYAVAERRLQAYLMRKGYSGSAVREATRAALDAAGVR